MSDIDRDSAYQEARSILERLAQSGFVPRAPVPPTAAPAHDGARKPTAPAPAPLSETAFRDLIEALPDAVAVIDATGGIVLVNAQTERLFDYSRGEMLGQPIELLIPDRFRSEHVEHRRRYFTEPRTRPMGVGMVLLGRRKGGAEFPVEISLSPMLTDRGPLATSVIRDVSRREREEAKFRTLVENIPAVTFFAPLDETTPELYVSPQIEELLGFSQKEWLEDPVLWYRQLHPDDRERWSAQFAPTCAAGTPFRAVYRFMAKDGRVVWVHGSAHLVRDAEGRPLFLQGVAFDITKIKDAEERLRQLNTELERRVAERTEALARSMAELRGKTDDLEQFARVASHDLYEPLRTLVNWPEQLAKHYGGQLDEKANEWINRTINGAKRMRRLIDDVSQYSRVLRRDKPLVPVDCAAAAREACANLQAALEESGATLATGELPMVAGNHQQLMLLFQNLVGNAIKYRDRARPIRVELGARRDGGGWLCWVRDNGIGIDAKYHRRIFGLGVESRLHSAKEYPGTGFGLAICEKIVTAHGGRIWVESEAGVGSTFYFTLPASVEA